MRSQHRPRGPGAQGPRVQGPRGTGVQGYRGTGVQGYRGTGAQGYRGPGAQGSGYQGPMSEGAESVHRISKITESTGTKEPVLPPRVDTWHYPDQRVRVRQEKAYKV